MKIYQNGIRMARVVSAAGWWLLVALLLAGSPVPGGTWVPLIRQPPNGVGLMLLLSDGTVLAASRIPALPETFPPSLDSKGWYRLHPDIFGHYVAGLWTQEADMHDARLFYASAVLPDGRVLVAGGEYGPGAAKSEVFDPVAGTWTQYQPVPAGLLLISNNAPWTNQNKFGFSDSGCKLLADGTVMVAPVYPQQPNATLIFDPANNSWRRGAFNLASQNEASWVKLPDDSILTVDKFGTNSERYIPALNKWFMDRVPPVQLFENHQEIGPAILLPNGKALFLGGTGKTALYTPAGGTNYGSWETGPDIPDGLVAADSPAAMLVNGRVLCAVSTGYTNGPTSFFEYDPTCSDTGCFRAVDRPPLNPNQVDDAPFGDTMLALPDGTILFSHNYGVVLGGGIFIYQPDGAPLAAGKPRISSIRPNADGSYHVTGTLLNGISEGAVYGEDAQMDSNYPLVRLTDSLGLVSYARTHHWSSTGVMQPDKVVTTEFDLPSGLLPGDYNVAVVANGIASDTVMLPHLVYVDKNSHCLTIDDLPEAFKSFALANPPPGLQYGTFDCVTINLDPPFPDRPPDYPSDWPWKPDINLILFPNPPPLYPAGWPWPPIDPPPTEFGLGGPFRVLGEAVSTARTNDRIQIKSANYNERLRITKPLRLVAEPGNVSIGRP